jgi:hypothetical protein
LSQFVFFSKKQYPCLSHNRIQYFSSSFNLFLQQFIIPSYEEKVDSIYCFIAEIESTRTCFLQKHLSKNKRNIQIKAKFDSKTTSPPQQLIVALLFRTEAPLHLCQKPKEPKALDHHQDELVGLLLLVFP